MLSPRTATTASDSAAIAGCSDARASRNPETASSATPQIVGVVALVVEQARRNGKILTTDAVRDLFEQTAFPVEKGNNAQGFPAVGHPNIAVGFGLVDTTAALAKL